MEKETKVEHQQASMAAKSVFKHFDTDKNGYLDTDEVLCFLKALWE